MMFLINKDRIAQLAREVKKVFMKASKEAWEESKHLDQENQNKLNEWLVTRKKGTHGSSEM